MVNFASKGGQASYRFAGSPKRSPSSPSPRVPSLPPARPRRTAPRRDPRPVPTRPPASPPAPQKPRDPLPVKVPSDWPSPSTPARPAKPSVPVRDPFPPKPKDTLAPANRAGRKLLSFAGKALEALQWASILLPPEELALLLPGAAPSFDIQLNGHGWQWCYDDGNPMVMFNRYPAAICGVGGSPLQVPEGPVEEFDGQFWQWWAPGGAFPQGAWVPWCLAFGLGQVPDPTTGEYTRYALNRILIRIGSQAVPPEFQALEPSDGYPGPDQGGLGPVDKSPAWGNVPGRPGLALPRPNLGWFPAYDPMTLPIGIVTPVPVPLPLPVSGVTPSGRDPLESRGGSEPSRPVEPVVEVPPVIEPWHPWPSTDFETSGGPVRQAQGNHFNEPPGRGEKERKGQTFRNSMIPAILGTLTEAGDIIDAFYTAIPAKGTGRRWKGRDGKWREAAITPQGKLAFIFKHADKIDLTKAFENLAENAAEDFVLGRGNQIVNKALSKTGYWKRPFGYGAGPAT